MMQDRELFERAAGRFDPVPQGAAWERLLTRRDRKRRNQRIAAAILALLITGGAVVSVVRAFGITQTQPATPTVDRTSVSDLHLVGTGTFGGQARSVTVADGILFVQGNGGTHALTAFPADCGSGGRPCSPLWAADVGNTPVVPEFATWAANGVVYVSTDRLYAFSATCASDGSVCQPLWTGTVEGRPFEPVVAGGGVYVPSSAGRLYRFPTSCATIGGACRPDWVSAPSPTRLFHPQVIGNAIVVQRFAPPSYVAYPLSCRARCTPEGSWRAPKGTLHGAIPTTTGNSIYIGATTGPTGTLFAYPLACVRANDSCRPTWSADLPGEVNAPPPFAAEGKVFVGSTAGGFLKAYAADCAASTCGPLWTARVPNLDFTHPAIAGGVVFAGSRDGGLYAFPSDCGSGDASCRPVWTWGTGGNTPVRIEAVATSIDHVYAISSDGHVYVFGLGSPSNAYGATSAPPLVPYLLVVVVIGATALVVRRRRGRVEP